MPTQDEHKKQAENNAKLAEFLAHCKEVQSLDWVVTVSFYAALHYVMWVFAKHTPTVKLYDYERQINSDIDRLKRDLNLRNPHHSIRSEILLRNFPAAYMNYHPLWTMADKARYYCYKVTEPQANEALRRLREIKKWAAGFGSR